MPNTLEAQIAGNLTRSDWQRRRAALEAGEAGWHEAFNDFFVQRLKLRYLDPIKVLQENGTFQGEGFSILAIQCSLIEFLESTYQGLSYRWVRRPDELQPFEYCKSSNIFVSFLSSRSPFSATFSATSALDFYTNVRCGLLHEASTKGGWKVWAQSPNETVADVEERIVYRNTFQAALLQYITSYGSALSQEPELQAAFIRKFDALAT